MMSSTKSTVGTGPVLFQKVGEVAQGGFTLDDASFAIGDVIPAGTPIGFNEATRIAVVAKTAVLYADATNIATTYQVRKGHTLKVGQSPILAGGTARPITAIDTAGSPLYDTLTFGVTIGVAASAGAALYIADAGYTAVKGLLFADVILDATKQADVTVVLRGTVYDRRITSPLPASMKALLPLIIFSQSY
jgi:hypothetical protein